jgi:predicted metal-dependent hydrolase
MNKTENIQYYPSVGKVRYVRNRRAKNLSIRINQQGEVRVTVPGFVGFKRAETFLLSKRHWIVAKRKELVPSVKRTSMNGIPFASGGRPFPLK